MIPLYIDPGTGSALFSIVVGLATTAYFFAKHLWVWIKGRIRGSATMGAGIALGRAGIVIYSEGARYWNVFKPVVEELERRGIPAQFLSSDEQDPALSNAYSSVKATFIGNGNAAFARLNMLEADVCLMTTPGLDVYQLKRSRGVRHYAHILHSVDDATSYRLFGLDYFDSVLLSGEYQGKAIRELEAKRGLKPKALPVVGSTYLDVYAAELDSLSREPARPGTVLVSPSWGQSGLLRRYGADLLLPLARTGAPLIVRPHPQSLVSEPESVAAAKAALAGFSNVEWDFSRENIVSLSRADLMVSDFSGIVFDYAFLLGRPVLYVQQDYDARPYDSSDVTGRPWKFQAIERMGRELLPADFERIGAVIESTRSDAGIAAAIAEAKDMAWAYRGQAGARTVDFLLGQLG